MVRRHYPSIHLASNSAERSVTGSWFTLERWITSVPFHSARPPAHSDFDVASGPNAEAILKKHWDTWIVADDWNWLVEHGVNTVRIPVCLTCVLLSVQEGHRNITDP